MMRLLKTLCLLLCLPALLSAQSYVLTPSPGLVILSSSGTPLSGAKVYTYQPGTTTPLTTYSDSSGTPNANPVVADSAGRVVIYLLTTSCVKFIVKTSADVTQYTRDNICPPSNASTTLAILDTNFTVKDDGDNTKILAFQASGISTGTTRTLTAPNANTTIVGTDNTATLTNKTLTDASTSIADDSDATKVARFQASGITTGTTRTYTFPDANTTLVGTDNTATLTSKTLTSPTITTPTISSTSSGRSRVCSVPVGSVAYGSFGTDTTPVAGTIYVAEVWLPVNMTVTGVSILNGSAVSGNVIVGLYPGAGGAILANSALAGTAQSGTNAFQDVAFTGTYAATGPARYYMAWQVDNTTARARTVAASTFVDVLTKSTAGTFGTLTSLTAPTTFTANVGIVGCLY